MTVSDFEFRAFNNATATLLISCGWPRGGGEKARFEKIGKNWIYSGAESGIRL